MIEVTVKLLPFGSRADEKTIATISIANAGRDNLYRYTSILEEMDGTRRHHVGIVSHDRNQNVLYLLRHVLRSLISRNCGVVVEE